MSFLSELSLRFKNGDSLIRLLMVNTATFILINIILLLCHLTDTELAVGEDLTLAASSGLQNMLHRPWSLLTHMFAHVQFGHFLFNMVALYTMGQMFLALQGSRKLLTLYLLGGLCGYLLFVIAYNLSPMLNAGRSHYVLGASAAVMAIVVATATLEPKRTVFLFGVVKIQLMWLAGILVLLDLASVRQGVNSGGHIGHLGGAILGFIYARQLQRGTDLGKWLNVFISWITSWKSRRKMKVASNNARPKSDEQFNLEKKKRIEKTDAILDKISKSGYDSLTKEEKDFLFRHSQK